MSRPVALWTPPFLSLTPTISRPRREEHRARPTDVAEALNADRALSGEADVLGGLAHGDHHPRPVASPRPRDPPSSTGLPVTTAVSVWPTCIE